MSDLTPSERRVARSLLARGPMSGLDSSSNLAKQIGVSGPTVSRFVVKLGFANYAEFQQALRTEVREQITSPVTMYPPAIADEDGDGDALLTRSLGATTDALTTTMRGISPDELSKAAALLLDPRRPVFAFGGRFSHVLARHLVDLFQELRAGVRYVETTHHERLAALSEVGKRHVVVVFDFRRYEHDTIALAHGMHDRGARIILITDPWLSPLAEIADVALPATLGKPSPFDSLVPAMALIEVLMTSVVDELGARGRAHFERFNTLVESYVPSWGTREYPQTETSSELDTYETHEPPQS